VSAAGTPPVGPAARWFEDFAVGEVFHTQGRTVTATESTLWSMFTGDMNPVHVDADFARRHSAFGTTVPQGLLAVAIASGLQERLGIFTGTGMAMLGQTIRYRAPVLIGDTIAVRMTVARLRPASRPGAGHVGFDYAIEVLDRIEDAVTGTLDILCACRPVSAAGTGGIG
jgi:acyl dehydratase